MERTSVQDRPDLLTLCVIALRGIRLVNVSSSYSFNVKFAIAQTNKQTNIKLTVKINTKISEKHHRLRVKQCISDKRSYLQIAQLQQCSSNRALHFSDRVYVCMEYVPS